MRRYFFVASYAGELYYNDNAPRMGYLRAWSAAGALKKAKVIIRSATAVVEIYHNARDYHRSRNILIRG